MPDPAPGDPAPTGAASEAPAGSRPGVRLTKRLPVTPPEPSAPRDKICAECGITFHLDTGKKFYLCPDCYRRSFARQRGGKDTARILTHITCARCGAQEYLPFVPEDPAKALCRTCFAAERPEPKRPSRHPRR